MGIGKEETEVLSMQVSMFTSSGSEASDPDRRTHPSSASHKTPYEVVVRSLEMDAGSQPGTVRSNAMA